MEARALRFVCVSLLLFLSPFVFAEDPVVPPRVVRPVDETERTVLKGNTHRLARPEYDRGSAPPNLPMNRMLLVLKRSPQQESALLKLLDEQQDSHSANYHKWLTPESFGKQFGPADQDIQAVSKWLESHGFQVERIAHGRNLIEFSGVASQVQEAFHTSIHKFVVNGEEHWANSTDPSIPAALTPVVAGVHTLHNFLKKPLLHVSENRIQAKLEPQGPGKPPKVTFTGNPPLHALGPADFATIYNINPLYRRWPPINGGVISIAVIARSNIDQNDFYDFQNVFGLAGQPYGQGFVGEYLNGPDPGNLGGGEEVEAMLDATWAAAVAPGATVYRVVSASTNTTDGVDLSEAYSIDNTLGSVMTESFGTCEASVTSTEAQGFATLAEQAAAQGTTYLVSSGDSGAEGCDNPNFETTASGPVSVNVLAATPFTLAVGGTMFNENGQDTKYWNTTNNQYPLSSALSYIPEDVWNESCTAAECGDNAGIWAGGGGASTYFAKPQWQSGVAGIPKDGARDVPDISLTAAGHDPYLLCLQRSCVPDPQGFIHFFAVSGTSASAPAFAGIMAMVQQKMGAPQGHAGYILYKLAATEKFSDCNASKTSGLPAKTCIFNDITSGNNAVPGEKQYGEPDAQYQSSVGYDLTTGLGSVNVTNLVDKWNTITFRPTLTNLVMNPTNITHGQPVNFTATVTPQNGTGTPTGDLDIGDLDIRFGTFGSLGLYTLSGGTVSGTITSIPGGSWLMEAQYAGDETFAPSTSGLVGLQVTSEPSTTALRGFTLNKNYQFVPFGDIEYGTFVYLRADVKGQSGNGVATGNVTFSDAFGSIIPGNPFQLNSEGNTETPNFLNSPLGGQPRGLYTFAPGPHNIFASYNGDPSFNPSTSPPFNFDVVPAITTPTLQFTPGATHGAKFIATINTNSGGTPPTGTVTFFVNGKPVGSNSSFKVVRATTDPLTGTLVPAQASTTYIDSNLTNGSYTIKISYSGDQNYLASTSSTKVTLQPDFTISAQPSVVTVANPGTSGFSTLTITGSDSFKGTINLNADSCSGLPAGASCSFSPSAITGNGSSSLTISTTGATSGMLLRHDQERWAWWMASAGIGLPGFFLIGVPRRRRRLSMLSIAVFALLVFIAGCGGGGGGSASSSPSGPPTPKGSYTVTVRANSGSLSHKVTFTLNVGQ